jgi:hypothetical protein
MKIRYLLLITCLSLFIPHHSYPSEKFNRLTNNFGDFQASTLPRTCTPYLLNYYSSLNDYVNSLPILDPVDDQSVDEKAIHTVHLTASDMDGGRLTFWANDIPTFSRLIDNGDGTASLIFTPSFEDSGTYPVTVTVSDDGCPFDIASESFNITVNNINRAPVLYIPVHAYVKEGDPRQIALLASDEDGDTLSFSETGLPPIANLIDNGDGTAALTLNVPSDEFAGTYFSTITVTDNGFPPESVSEEIEIDAEAVYPYIFPGECYPPYVREYYSTWGDTTFEPPFFIYGDEVSYIAQVGEKFIIDVRAGETGWYQRECYQCVRYDSEGNIVGYLPMQCHYNEHNVVSNIEFIGLPETANVYELGLTGMYSSKKRIEWTPQESDVGIRTIEVIARTRKRTEDLIFGGTTWSDFILSNSQNIKIAVNALKVHSIEFTQAIQVEQTPTEMQTYLNDHNGVLPVPLIAEKPGAMRVNFGEIPIDTDVNVVMILATDEGVELWEEQEIHISNQCTPHDRRRQSTVGKVPCNTANFYTIEGEPPEGTYTMWVLLEYPDSHNLPNLYSSIDQEAKWAQLIPLLCEDENDFSCQALSYPPILNRFDANRFTLNVKRSDEVVIGTVSVCAKKVDGKWQCFPNPIGALRDRIEILKKIAPTHSVKVERTGKTIKLEAVGNINGDVLKAHDDDPDLCDCYDRDNNIVFNGYWDANWNLKYTHYDRTKTPVKCEQDMWWMNVALRINRLYTMYEQFMEPYVGRQKYYFGLFDNDPPNPNLGPWAGEAYDMPSRGAVGAVTSDTDFDNEIVAHETGHMLGARHTNTDQPDGSCELSLDDCSLWPYGDNHIQSGPGPYGDLEVGFDVENYSVIPQPDNTFDIMSYCFPRWISPHTYKKFGETLIQSGIPLVHAMQAEVLTTPGTFWLVSGFIGDGEVALSPVFAFETVGPVEPGTGIFRIEIHDATGNVLVTRFFTPFVPRIESPASGIEVKGLPTFSELVPYQSSGTNLLIIDNVGTTIAQETLGGVAPTVSIDFPTGGETLSGDQVLLWSVSDPDSSTHVFWIDYSPDGGSSWNTLAQEIAESSLQVNFDELAGSTNESLIRVSASDGANTGLALSNSFSVPKKLPVGEIISPIEGSQIAFGVPIYFEGLGSDIDDGVLNGTALVWQSNVDGFIGNGDEFSVSDLSEGTHTVTLEVTDSDNNQSSDAITISIVHINPGEIAPCDGDLDLDRDVDGSDLATFAVSATEIALEEFAADFGRTDCPLLQ